MPKLRSSIKKKRIADFSTKDDTNVEVESNPITINGCIDAAKNDFVSRYFSEPVNMSLKRLTADFFTSVDTIRLTKSLLGQILCRKIIDSQNQIKILKGRIVETESYLGRIDAASHSFNGRRTDRNEPMFMEAGTTYVYFTYGMYHCFNLSSQDEGGAVLIRAIEPLEGIDVMLKNRVERLNNRKSPTKNDLIKSGSHKQMKLKNIANGPSKLCIALNIDKNLNKLQIATSEEIWIEEGESVAEEDIVVCKRIGINNAGVWNDKPLRFYVRSCEYISIKDKKAESSL